MDKKYIILSDIHGNVSAFDAVLSDLADEDPAGIILLGDLIDYGMRSNEIVERVRSLAQNKWRNRILVNIRGNHEKLVTDKDLERLSSDRGRVMARYTAEHLSADTVEYIRSQMNETGRQEFELGGKRCLAVHGSLDDPFWKAIEHDDLRGDYSAYDMVFGGHSHIPHCFTHFYRTDDPELRNKKAVVFINPGSVGQPRNQNPYAQYAVISLPSGRVELRAVPYDIGAEQALYPDEIDEFYKNRLKRGI